tara:strand:+ start:726 stop:1154 length:429 start_codon:yes stop_codon:yes gene_type:complete
MKLKFCYNFAKSKKEESPKLDIEGILDSVTYIVCPLKRLARPVDDMENALVYLFHNAVPHVAIFREYMVGNVTIQDMNPVKATYDGPGTKILYHGRMDYESVCMSKNHKTFTRDTNLDCYFSIHSNADGQFILYIGSPNTRY